MLVYLVSLNQYIIRRPVNAQLDGSASPPRFLLSGRQLSPGLYASVIGLTVGTTSVDRRKRCPRQDHLARMSFCMRARFGHYITLGHFRPRALPGLRRNP